MNNTSNTSNTSNINMFDTDKALSELVTDRDHEVLFTGLIKEGSFTKFSELETKVKEVFGEKLDKPLKKFAGKLALDRNRLKELFINN